MNNTPLHAWHVANKATMTEFAGWDMPLYYRGITDEHLHTRKSAGLFDTSHMGRIQVSGSAAHAFVNYLTPVRSDAAPGQVCYSFVLNEQGCPIDDITVYTESPNELMLVVNGGSREQVVEWIRTRVQGWKDVSVVDRTLESAMFALQGPRSTEVMEKLFGDAFTPLPYYHFARLKTPNRPFNPLISSTGYTGEQGYEIYLPAAHAVDFWSEIIATGGEDVVWPVGLGARDSLRLEAAMPLYGHELSQEITPFMAGLGKFIDMEKEGFIGREALLKERESNGPKSKLVGIEMVGRGPTPRHGFVVTDAAGAEIGKVTSGIMSPTLQKNIALAFVKAENAKVGTEVCIDIRGRRLPAVIVKRPFYRRSS